MTVAPPVPDPFENEVTLAPEPRVLAFSPRGFEIPMPELLRHLAFDLVGGIPRPLGETSERLEGGSNGSQGPVDFRQAFYQVNPSVLAICTEIEEPRAAHRVLELLGVGENTRVRLNLTRWPAGAPAELAEDAARAAEAGRPLGQVRVWASENQVGEQVRRILARQMQGMSPQILSRHADEPTYRPPASERLHLDALPKDQAVVNLLLELLARSPVPGAKVRPARRLGAHDDRVRRKTSIVSYHYELHRAATGVVHARRREVEAGVERPGLVRTFNAAGLAGAARLRIRDVGGRATAEYAGTAAAVERIRAALVRSMGGRA